jgi:hypothetical protein
VVYGRYFGSQMFKLENPSKGQGPNQIPLVILKPEKKKKKKKKKK